MTASLLKNTNPFHEGELVAQSKAGTRGVAVELGVGITSKLDYDRGHAHFLGEQQFAVITSVTPKGNVWVTPLFGEAGFIRMDDEKHLTISNRAIPPGDILFENSRVLGSPLSLFVIDLKRRIRHRINGCVVAACSVPREKDRNIQLHMEVKEYMPNCPKYINRREMIASSTPLVLDAFRSEAKSLSNEDSEMIRQMDTLFIGTNYTARGADLNHRGGRPGFIRVLSSNEIAWPEYRGNGMFQTSGNLEMDNHSGVTVVDFDTGNVLQMTGNARVDWSANGKMDGATRMIYFSVEEVSRFKGVTKHRWNLLEYSPYNPIPVPTGKDDNDGPTRMTLAKIVTESPVVKTFRWIAPKPIRFLPGQYATFEFDNIPGAKERRIVRTWTLSETPNSVQGDNTLDISVKRKECGLVSNWLHDHAKVGLTIKFHGVQGEMTPIQPGEDGAHMNVPSDLLLISGGIGITPNLAIVRGLGAFEMESKTRITMIHQERNRANLPFQSELRRRSKNYPSLAITNVISSEEGRITEEKLKALVPNPEKQTAYLCGPPEFMRLITKWLVVIGLPATRIVTETFDF